MNIGKLVIRSFIHYIRSGLTASVGIAIAVAVITGAFITGDSLKHSLLKSVELRLGNITHSVTAGERVFTRQLAEKISIETGTDVSAGLIAEGVVSVTGGDRRVNKVHIFGVDNNFSTLLGSETDLSQTGHNEVIISQNLASRLEVEPGDFIMLRMKRTGIIPMNTPLVSDADQSVSRRVQVAAVATDDEFGRFNMRVSQTAPYNIFVNIAWLNSVMEMENMANILYFSNPDADNSVLTDIIPRVWSFSDANLAINHLTEKGVFDISSERVFIEPHVSTAFNKNFPESEKHLTYFVNTIQINERSTPYSFIAATSRYDLKSGETLINRWLADDLSALPGDTVTVKYFETGPLRELVERERKFVVKGVVEMEDLINDTLLMPHLPGLSDAGNCRDWEAGVPIVLDKIRDKDEDYWEKYRGIPKAYVSIEEGQQLWTNRFGNLTSIQIPDTVGINQITAAFRTSVTPSMTGYQFNELRKDGLRSAEGGVDFGMLFGGLGFFVIASGIILFVLLLAFNIENRSEQISLFTSLGFNSRMIKKIYLSEGLLISFSGIIAGLFLGIFYARGIHYLLSEMWHDIVRTGLIEMVILPQSIILTLIISAVIATTVIILGLNRYLPGSKKKSKSGINQLSNQLKTKGNALLKSLAVILIAAPLLIVSVAIFTGKNNPVLFFISGALLITGLLLSSSLVILKIRERYYYSLTRFNLTIKNLSRNFNGSISVIIMLALGIFVVVATGSHRKEAERGDLRKDGGTGGFQLVAESTVPILYNLNRREVQLDLNIPADLSFIQFMSSYADDASCLNLNEVSNPRIIAVNPEKLTERFSFSSSTKYLNKESPWMSLENDISGAIPAIADMSVIQWGLNKKPGDTLYYTNERGEELKLLLIGGLANSIFQGNIIISENNFLKNFPSASGTNFTLIEVENNNLSAVAEELEFIFRDHGWEMAEASYRLNEFNSIENRYLTIFLMLGALGVLIGVTGLAALMARNILVRRKEIALYISLGFKSSTVSGIIFKEYLILLTAGVLTGLPPALIAGLPSLTGTQSVNIFSLLLITLAIFINGVIWIGITSQIMIRRVKLKQALSDD